MQYDRSGETMRRRCGFTILHIAAFALMISAAASAVAASYSPWTDRMGGPNRDAAPTRPRARLLLQALHQGPAMREQLHKRQGQVSQAAGCAC
jgi:hypothetical protein